MNDDSRLAKLRELLSARAPAVIRRDPSHAEAAVALVLRAGDPLELLFIQRAERDSDPWSGHIAFPGGRRSPGDPTLLSTATRETEEETGIELVASGLVLGGLDEIEPATRRLPAIVIAPFVLAVPATTEAHPDPREVRTAAWVPLAALRDPGAASELSITPAGQPLSFPSIVWRDYVIWGLTHRILLQFLELAGDAGL